MSQSITIPLDEQGDVQARATVLFEEHRRSIYRRTDRLFAYLMVIQWLGGIAAALWISPRTWAGPESATHVHVWAAIFLGGAIASLPIAMAYLMPGTATTRHVIAVAQVSFSALLIHLTGGRIETHFHVFGSLAFLAFYRDWRVLVTASAVVAVDHILRGLFWPQSVYGVLTPTLFRSFEHAGWVVFEDIFLIWSCKSTLREMWNIAEQHALLETTNAAIKTSQVELRAAKDVAEAADQAKGLILDTALDAIVTIDSDGLITTWNPQAEATFGWGREEVVGSCWHQKIIAERYRDTVWAGVRNLGPEGRALNERIETVALHRDAREFPIELSVRRATSGAGSIFTAFIRDITERKHAEAELRNAKESAEAANRAKSDFLARMSHEVRTPLNGVVGMIDVLRATDLTSGQQRYAQLARDSSNSLLRVINDILDFSKVEAGKVELEAIEFDLGRLVEDLTEVLAPVAAKKKLGLVCTVRHEVPRQVIGDPNRIRQVLTNLVNNSLKFTERGRVSMRVSLDGRDDRGVTVRVAVEDTGIGVPADRLGRLFQSFSQVDTSTTRKYGGTGLGLAISKRLVELMGGEIGVTSEVGRGTTFWFTLRLGHAEAPGPAAIDGPAEALRAVRVLVVEPEADARLIVSEQLDGRLSPASAVVGPDEALAALREAARAGRPFAAALIPFETPAGQALRAAVRGDAALARVELIALMGIDASADEEALTQAGFAGRMHRPLTQSRLLDAIASVTVRRPTGAKAAPAPAPAPGAAHATLRGLHLLVAEDNEMNQFVTEVTLRRVGCTCDIVGDGRLAVAAVRAKGDQYDAVLMDCQMPEMGGLEASRCIRELEAAAPGSRRLAIIALTAEAIQGDREKCLAAGMDGYVTKPINAEDLFAALTALARLKRGAPHDLPAVAVTPIPAPSDESGADATRLPGQVRQRVLSQVESLRRLLADGDQEAVQATQRNLESIARELLMLAEETSRCAAPVPAPPLLEPA